MSAMVWHEVLASFFLLVLFYLRRPWSIVDRVMFFLKMPAVCRPASGRCYWLFPIPGSF